MGFKSRKTWVARGWLPRSERSVKTVLSAVGPLINTDSNDLGIMYDDRDTCVGDYKSARLVVATLSLEIEGLE